MPRGEQRAAPELGVASLQGPGLPKRGSGGTMLGCGLRQAPRGGRGGGHPYGGRSKARSPSGTRQVPVRAASDWRRWRLVAYSVVS